MHNPQNSDLQSSSASRRRRGDCGTAIILAGGLGTRLKSVVSDLPKCMAPVSGKPFLHYVIRYLQTQEIDQYIFSVGYKSEAIIDYVNEQYPTLNKHFSIEEEPLGTGGAIKLACKLVPGEDVVILNGDTLFNVDISKLAGFHEAYEADCSLALKPMQDFNRYGVVELHDDARIKSFKEKEWYASGTINGGVYVLNTDKFLQENLPQKFSFEKDYLEQFYDKRKMYALVDDAYFIDIGIPEDLERAQKELV